MEYMKTNFFTMLYDWIKNIIFGKTTNHTENETENTYSDIIYDDVSKEITRITLNFYGCISGYEIKNAKLTLNNDVTFDIGDIKNNLYEASKVVITSDIIDFAKIDSVKMSLDLESTTGEIIHLGNSVIDFDSLNYEGKQIFYKITSQNLNLKPISFNATVEDYKKPIEPTAIL